jgi:hypothetical protein
MRCDGGHSIGRSFDWSGRGSELSCTAVAR